MIGVIWATVAFGFSSCHFSKSALVVNDVYFSFIFMFFISVIEFASNHLPDLTAIPAAV